MAKSHHLAVFLPEKDALVVKARAADRYGSVSRYLKALIEQDQTPTAVAVSDEISRLHKRLDEVLEFSRYLMVVQNATAERLSPGLVEQVQNIYREQFGEAPNAR